MKTYWIHVKRSLDQAMLHRENCLEVPANPTTTDFWEGGWFDYPSKEIALDALEQTGATQLLHCPLCRP